MKQAAFVLALTLTSLCSSTPAIKQKLLSLTAGGNSKHSMAFEPNEGRFDPQFQFASSGRGYEVLLGSREATLKLHEARGQDTTTLRMKLQGGSATTVLRGAQFLPGKLNYFHGTSDNWMTDIPTYARIVADEVYPGIDVEYYSKDDRFEYDLIVHPGTSPEAIRIAFEGASAVRVSSDGDLVISSGNREIRQLKPFVYQDVKGRRVSIAANYVTEGDVARFVVPHYDRTRDLIIDPQVVYSSYVEGDNETRKIAVDARGYIYIAGDVWNGDIYTIPSRDAFVTKLRADGTVVWSSSFGNPAGDQTALDLAVDADGNVYATGWTNGDTESPNPALRFPTITPVQPTPVQNLQAFVTKFNADGGMVYSTTIGGDGIELGKGIALDFGGNIFVTGQTGSTDFTTVKAFQPLLHGGSDAFLLVLDSQGSRILYSTYIGGNDSDEANAIVIDKSGNACIAGSTSSRDFPLQVPIQAIPDASVNAFIMKFTTDFAAGLVPAYSTYLGGNGSDMANALAIDAADNLYVAGSTSSTNFPAVHPYQADLAVLGATGDDRPTDAFVTKIDPSGSTLVYSTYLGSGNDDWATGIAVGSSGNAFVVGSTASRSFPQIHSLQPFKGATDAFVAELSSDGTSLLYATLFGGSTAQSPDQGLPWTTGVSIVRDSITSSVYITGVTSTTDLPTTVRRSCVCCLSSPLSPYLGKTSFLAKLADDVLPISVTRFREMIRP